MKLAKTKIFNINRMDKYLSTSELLESTGYIKQIGSGLYVHMHLMKNVINNIEKIIKEELNKIGCLEIGLNQIQSADLWKITGRYNTYGSEMFKINDRNSNEIILTGTNEELVTFVSKEYISSYRDLSFTFYQINNKFRDEIRCNSGLIRSKEFLMMDAYSFHENIEQLKEFYSEMSLCYQNIFNRLGLKFRIEKADSGEIGGSISEEFVVETSDGEIEIGHIFQLDDKYSSAMNVQYVDRKNTKQNVIMGCYGIGITRLAQVLADIGRDNNNLNFSENISAYKYGILIGNIKNEKQKEIGELLYSKILKSKNSVYIDDRDIRIGQKLNEIDIIGTSIKILVGNNIEKDLIEIKYKSFDKWNTIKINDFEV